MFRAAGVKGVSSDWIVSRTQVNICGYKCSIVIMYHPRADTVDRGRKKSHDVMGGGLTCASGWIVAKTVHYVR